MLSNLQKSSLRGHRGPKAIALGTAKADLFLAIVRAHGEPGLAAFLALSHLERQDWCEKNELAANWAAVQAAENDAAENDAEENKLD